MAFKETVQDLLEEGLASRDDLFLIDFKLTSDNRILVTLDGDNGVTLQDCIDISRAIEHNLDREEVDFALEVASAGAASPLQIPRQYKKNIGRKLSVSIEGETLEGTLIKADEESLLLQWKAREPKPVGKGKHTVTKERKIPYTAINEAKVILKF